MQMSLLTFQGRPTKARLGPSCGTNMWRYRPACMCGSTQHIVWHASMVRACPHNLAKVAFGPHRQQVTTCLAMRTIAVQRPHSTTTTAGSSDNCWCKLCDMSHMARAAGDTALLCSLTHHQVAA
jgi:hypothetical protein